MATAFSQPLANIKNSIIKEIIILVVLTIPISCFAQNCNVGNDDSTGFDNSVTFFANGLGGINVYLATADTLLSLNLLGRNTGSRVQMALYNDNNGVPENLIVTSNVDTVGPGVVSFPVSPIPLLAGYYWIMVVYEWDGGHTYSIYPDTGNIIYSGQVNFGDSIPINASHFSSLSNFNFAYFMEISCNTTDILEVNSQNKIKIFPNPSTDYIYITGLQNEVTCRIVDLKGQYINEFLLDKNLTKIDITNLNKGCHFLIFDNESHYRMRFIKN